MDEDIVVHGNGLLSFSTFPSYFLFIHSRLLMRYSKKILRVNELTFPKNSDLPNSSTPRVSTITFINFLASPMKEKSVIGNAQAYDYDKSTRKKNK